MRPILPVILLLSTVALAQAEPAPRPRPHSADILLRVHPLPWRAPVAAVAHAPGLRLEPDTGESTDPATLGTSAAAPGGAHPLAGVPVSTRADGSRFAILAGKLRAYSVVTIGADGRLEQDCVHSEEEALQVIRRASKSGGR